MSMETKKPTLLFVVYRATNRRVGERRNMVKIKTMLLATIMLLPMQSFAHTTWINRDPVPSYVKESCCGPSDAHHLTPEQVHIVSGGFRVDGYVNIVEQSKLTPSPDGEWWIFYKTYNDGSQSSVYCFFGPNFGT